MQISLLTTSLFYVFLVIQTLLPGTFSQLTFPSNQITLQQGYIFYYEFIEASQTVRMGLQINRDVDYFAVGFSQEANNGMRNFDIAAFIFNPTTNAVEVRDLYATATGNPPTDVSRGGSADYTLIDSYVVNGMRQVLFERPYNTGDTNDYQFSSDQDGQRISINWAWLSNGQGTIAYHGGTNRGTIKTALSYAQPQVEENPPEENPPEENPPEENPPEENPPEEAPEENPPEESPPQETPGENPPNTEPPGLRSSVPLTFPTNRVSLQNNGLIFHYEIFRETNTIRMGLDISRNVDYFAVGFAEQGRFGMEGFDIVAFVFSSSGGSNYNVQVQDLYATEYSHPPSDTSLGGTEDYRLVQYYATNGRRQVVFERALNTGDTHDYIFRPELNGTRTAVNWAWNSYGDSSLYYHDGNRGMLLIDMSYENNGNNGGNPIEEETQDPEEIVSTTELNFPPSKVYIPNGGLTFYFDFNDEAKMIKMGLEINRPVDYFGLGFADEGNSGMANFDLVAFTFNPSATEAGTYTVMVHDMYSTDNSRPPSDSARGGSSDYKLLKYYAGNNKRQVLFERPYDTNDVYDYTFHPERREANIAISWAWLISGGGYLDYHGRNNRGTILTQLFNGLDGVGRNYFTGINSDLFFKYHAYLFLAVWGVLVDVAIWIARYRKFSRFYITAHMALTSFIYVGTVILTAIALKLRASGVSGSIYETHLALGILILILSTLQVLLGFAFRYKIVGSDITKTIFPLSRIHMFLGILTYLVAKAQLFVGLSFYQPDYMGVLAAVYAVLFVLWLAYDYFFKRWPNIARRKAKILANSDSKSPKHQKLLELLNQNTPVSEILETPELKGLKWVILDNQVFELKNFTHPGGNFILKQLTGREVGRFIYGITGLESFTGNSQHIHSRQALLVVKKNFIGTVVSKNQVLVPSPERSPQSQIQSAIKASYNWSLLKKVKISQHTSKFFFACNDFEINPWGNDIRQLGKHMKVSHVSQKKVRLYTLVLSQTEARIQRRRLLEGKSKALFAQSELQKAHIKAIPLIIKKYESPKSQTFSSFIHNCSENMEGFLLEGPFGTGFGLTPQSTGLHMIFAAGTGVFPFLDLFDYLLENVSNKDGPGNIFKNGFKLQIFLTFGSMNDFVGLDICEKLIQACNDNELEGAVKMTIRVKEPECSKLFTWTNEKFDEEFVNKYVVKECEKVFVCGPPAFNQKIPESLGLLGINSSKIMLV